MGLDSYVTQHLSNVLTYCFSFTMSHNSSQLSHCCSVLPVSPYMSCLHNLTVGTKNILSHVCNVMENILIHLVSFLLCRSHSITFVFCKCILNIFCLLPPPIVCPLFLSLCRMLFCYILYKKSCTGGPECTAQHKDHKWGE